MKKNTKPPQPVNDEYIRETKNAVIPDLGKKMNFSDVKSNQQVRLMDSDCLLEFFVRNIILLKSILLGMLRSSDLSEVDTAVLEGRAQINQGSCKKLIHMDLKFLIAPIVNSVYLSTCVYLEQNRLKKERA